MIRNFFLVRRLKTIGCNRRIYISMIFLKKILKRYRLNFVAAWTARTSRGYCTCIQLGFGDDAAPAGAACHNAVRRQLLIRLRTTSSIHHLVYNNTPPRSFWLSFFQKPEPRLAGFLRYHRKFFEWSKRWQNWATFLRFIDMICCILSDLS